MTKRQQISYPTLNRLPKHWLLQKNIWLASIFAIAYWFASIAIAQDPAHQKLQLATDSRAQVAQWKLHALDGLVPVITMEFIGNGMNNLQSFRLQIFKEGKVRFQGFRGTKVLGEAQTFIKPEQVQRIWAEFAKYGFWKMPAYDLVPGEGSLDQTFTLRDGYKEKTLRSDAVGPHSLWVKAIEDEVNTSQWRCDSIKGSVASEQCDFFNRSQEQGVESFLRNYAQKHIRKYK